MPIPLRHLVYDVVLRHCDALVDSFVARLDGAVYLQLCGVAIEISGAEEVPRDVVQPHALADRRKGCHLGHGRSTVLTKSGSVAWRWNAATPSARGTAAVTSRSTGTAPSATSVIARSTDARVTPTLA